MLWVKQASSAWCQRWYRMCRGSRGTRSLCMESRPQPFALGVRSKFHLAPPFLSRAEGIQARGPAMVGASLVGVLDSGGRLGGLFTPTSLSGKVQSLGSQWFFYCEYCTRAVKMLVRTQLSLEGSPFSMSVLICSRVACGLDALPADGDTFVQRQSLERQSTVVLSLGWSLPWRLTRQGSGCSRKGPPQAGAFFCVTFFLQ